jgi:hypothetical protein
MDYKRIYEELIEHRKMMPRLEGVYYERHHIVPRCMGGGDEEENLIYLTAEDHYMAHMLLAHAYGGTLWHAAQLMAATRTIEGISVTNRRTFAMVRRKLGENMSQYVRDPVIHEFKNVITGEIVRCTQYELQQNFGLRPGATSALVTGASKRAGLFCMSGTEHIRHIKILDPTKYNFKHIETGIVYHMTRKEFSARFDLAPQVAHKLVDGGRKHSHGFCLESVTDFGGRRGTGEVFRFKEISTGNILEMNCRQMSETYGRRQTEWRKLAKGSCIKMDGFCLESTPLDHPDLYKLPRNSTHYLENISDGMVVKGTCTELAEHFHVLPSSVHRVICRKTKSCCGHVFLGTEGDPSFEPPSCAISVTELRCSILESSQSPLQAPSQQHHTPAELRCEPQAA